MFSICETLGQDVQLIMLRVVTHIFQLNMIISVIQAMRKNVIQGIYLFLSTYLFMFLYTEFCNKCIMSYMRKYAMQALYQN